MTNQICLLEAGLVWRVGSSTQQRQVMVLPLALQGGDLTRAVSRPRMIHSEPRPAHLREDITLYSSYSLTNRAFVDYAKGAGMGDTHTLSLHVSHLDGRGRSIQRSMLLEERHTDERDLYIQVFLDERTLVYAYRRKEAGEVDELFVKCRSFDPRLDLQKVLLQSRMQ